MSGIKYYVKDGDRYASFNDRILAFRYARLIGSKDIQMSVPDQVDWYYWDWERNMWRYP